MLGHTNPSLVFRHVMPLFDKIISIIHWILERHTIVHKGHVKVFVLHHLQTQKGLTDGPLNPNVKEMRPAATLKGVPVAVKAPMAGK